MLQKAEGVRLEKELKLRDKLTNAAKDYNKALKMPEGESRMITTIGGGSAAGVATGTITVTRESILSGAKQRYELVREELKKLNSDFVRDNKTLLDISGAAGSEKGDIATKPGIDKKTLKTKLKSKKEI